MHPLHQTILAVLLATSGESDANSPTNAWAAPQIIDSAWTTSITSTDAQNIRFSVGFSPANYCQAVFTQRMHLGAAGTQPATLQVWADQGSVEILEGLAVERPYGSRADFPVAAGGGVFQSVLRGQVLHTAQHGMGAVVETSFPLTGSVDAVIEAFSLCKRDWLASR